MPSGRGNSTDAERGSGVRRKKMRGRLYGNSFLFTKVSQVKQWEWRRNKEICLLLPPAPHHTPSRAPMWPLTKQGEKRRAGEMEAFCIGILKTIFLSCLCRWAGSCDYYD
ncbi:uncharacterized protein LOC116482213 isoform X1 [Hylobates moloch]|uniref:uncharacterized protein LOC116482213 isoform X1 n=1 Tax=Hylobates moloch TaxID=81572 RepID=UPI0013625426|nr:uncharacterized protein LOC116482213 isoform X1 [Hylobates moloch]XP_058283890.1 uncharacterized protein LOC116482213 isoform X1 [Hylobates moloch]